MSDNARLRVLITTGIFPPDIGGPATYVPQLAAALAARGHQVTVVTLSDRLDRDDGMYPFRVIRFARLAFKPWRWLRTAVSFIRLGRDADVLFVNGLAMEAVLANLLLRKPMVQKVVGDLAWERATSWGWVQDTFEAFQETRYALKVEALKALRSWWTRRADKIIVPSRYLAQWVARWGLPEDKIAVIYNAPDSPDGIQPMPVPLQTSLNVVTVGRLVSWKCVDQVIEVIARCEGAGLVVVGDGPERGRLEGLARSLGMAERVYFAGQKNRSETLGLMAGCDIFVLNSTYEGLPHVVLEAMGIGLPVLATAVGGTAEVVRDGSNGRLIDPLDKQGLQDALTEVIGSPFIRQRLAQGALRTAAQFSPKRMVDDTETLLRERLTKDRWAKIPARM